MIAAKTAKALECREHHQGRRWPEPSAAMSRAGRRARRPRRPRARRPRRRPPRAPSRPRSTTSLSAPVSQRTRPTAIAATTTAAGGSRRSRPTRARAQPGDDGSHAETDARDTVQASSLSTPGMAAANRPISSSAAPTSRHAGAKLGHQRSCRAPSPVAMTRRRRRRAPRPSSRCARPRWSARRTRPSRSRGRPGAGRGARGVGVDQRTGRPEPHQLGSYAGTCRLCAAWKTTAPNDQRGEHPDRSRRPVRGSRRRARVRAASHSPTTVNATQNAATTRKRARGESWSRLAATSQTSPTPTKAAPRVSTSVERLKRREAW